MNTNNRFEVLVSRMSAQVKLTVNQFSVLRVIHVCIDITQEDLFEVSFLQGPSRRCCEIQVLELDLASISIFFDRGSPSVSIFFHGKLEEYPGSLADLSAFSGCPARADLTLAEEDVNRLKEEIRPGGSIFCWPPNIGCPEKGDQSCKVLWVHWYSPGQASHFQYAMPQGWASGWRAIPGGRRQGKQGNSGHLRNITSWVIAGIRNQDSKILYPLVI